MTNTLPILITSPALAAFLKDVQDEARGAQRKFPGNAQKVAATAEELGELCKALLDHARGEATPQQVYTEAVQLAAMAAQIALGGSDELAYAFDMALHEGFVPTAALHG